MYKKAWCACKVVVLLIKPIAFLTFSLPSPSSLLKLPILFYPELFLYGFKNFHVHIQIPYVFKLNVTVLTYPTRIRIHFSTQDSARNIGNRACVVKRSKFAFCTAFSRLKTGLDLVTSPDKKYPDLASTRLRMHNGSLESWFKKVADLHSRFTGYEWTRRDLNQIVNTKRMKPDRWHEIWKFDENSSVAFGHLILPPNHSA